MTWLWMCAALALAAFLAAVRVGRHRPEQVARSTPPVGITPTQAASLIDSTTALPAEIIELALRGALHIRTGPIPSAIAITLVDPRRVPTGDAKRVCEALFAPETRAGSTVVLNDIPLDVRTRLISATGAVAKTPFAPEHRPRHSKLTWAIQAATVFLIAGTAVGIVLSLRETREVWGLLLGMAAIALAIAAIVLRAPRPYSKDGTRLRDELAGYRAFLKDNPEPDEAQLPFAIVFGLEHEWASALAEHYIDTAPPRWYSQQGEFSPESFVTTIELLARWQAHRASDSSSGAFIADVGDGGGGGDGGAV